MPVILDSGAFSAWSKNTEIDLDAYIDYALSHLDTYDYVVNLDVIPASPGQKKIPRDEIERSAGQGWANWEKMVSKGIPPERLIHVFHQNENFSWLQKMVANPDMPYIGLSPANDRSTSEKTKWLDDCMKHVLDKDGFPLVKWHGFAVTSIPLMRRYPWYSVDSSTWCVLAGLGTIMVPPKRKGAWDFVTRKALHVSVSAGMSGKDHYLNQSPTVMANIQKYLSEIGYNIGKSEIIPVVDSYIPADNERILTQRTLEGFPDFDPNQPHIERVLEAGVSNNYMFRYQVNAHYMNELQKTFPKWPWAYKRKSASLF